MKRKNELIIKKNIKKNYFFKNNFYVFVNYLKFFKLFYSDFFINFFKYLNNFFFFYKINFIDLFNFFYLNNYCFLKFNYFYNNRFSKYEFFNKVKHIDNTFFLNNGSFSSCLSFNNFYDKNDSFVLKFFDFFFFFL